MNISIFGLGYVGSVSLGCLARLGHKVIGVDVNESKVYSINQGKSPVVEDGLDQIIADQRTQGLISATTDGLSAIKETDVSFICVGTPSLPKGHLDLSGVFSVSKEIAEGIAKKDSFHIVVIRSTVLPGTNLKVAEAIETTSKKRNGHHFAVVSNPEFLREGTAVKDYFDPPYTLLGSTNIQATNMMREVYKKINAPLLLADIPVVELTKYVNNSFHALKIAFANEVGSICKKLGINSHELMGLFCSDLKLNLGPKYLKPGFAYGGSCLPKDLKALCTIAHDNYLKCPVLENIDASNDTRKEEVLNTIIAMGKQRIGFLGLSFKEGTDDLRYSPIIDIIERLLGKGFDIMIFDKNVHLSQLVGVNREYIMNRIPYISRFISENSASLVANSDLIVVVNNEEDHKYILEGLPENKLILDLVNIDFSGRTERKYYMGISW